MNITLILFAKVNLCLQKRITDDVPQHVLAVARVLRDGLPILNVSDFSGKVKLTKAFNDVELTDADTAALKKLMDRVMADDKLSQLSLIGR